MLVVEVEAGTAFTAGRPEVVFEALYDADQVGAGNQNYDVTADRRFLLITGDAGLRVRITVVLNWCEELKARVPVP